MNDTDGSAKNLSPQERLATIEKLAGEVSHSFNNQLTGLMGFANLIKMRAENENIKRYANEILTLCKSSSEMMKEFLMFARNRTNVVNINANANITNSANGASTASVASAIAKDNADENNDAAANKNGGAADKKCDGTILLVDDDDGIRNSVAAYLRNIGFSVFTAVNGEDAVEKYGVTHAAIDIVILDMVMPRMTGLEAFEKMKAINPNIKAICITGFNTYTNEEIMAKGILQILHKPFQFDELRDVILRHVCAR